MSKGLREGKFENVEEIRMKEEQFYIQDSLTGQDLRVISKFSEKQIDIFTSDASTNGSVHDHNFIDLNKGYAGHVYRGQQKLSDD